jgi:hypothetical protein
VKRAAPVPPFATERAELSESEPIVTVPRDAVWEKRLVELAMEEKRVVEVAFVPRNVLVKNVVVVALVVVESVKVVGRFG